MNEDDFQNLAKTKRFAYRTRSLLNFDGIVHFQDYRFGQFDNSAFSLADESIPDFSMPFMKAAACLDILPLESPNSRLCQPCSSIPIAKLLKDFQNRHVLWSTLSALRRSAECCDLCQMIRPFFTNSDSDDVAVILTMPRAEFLEIETGSVDRTPLRMCTDAAPEVTRRGIPVGFPVLRDHKGLLLPFLLRKWLEDCNQNHKHDADFEEDRELPTRVICVGDSEDSDIIRIWETSGTRGKYIALSHRWGKGDESFSTTKSNIKSRYTGVKLEQFPKTFQDAVRVTRMFGIQYLWIDSLCIIQRENDDDDDLDWKHESKRMESVFASAFCTIAATSAENSHDGFLRNSPSKRFVTLRDKLWDETTHSSLDVYVSEDTEDFHHHVDKAALNQRGWVFQERALSPRTIHFTKAHIYWECGSVIRSECLEEIYRRSNWLGDSQFPKGAARLDQSLRDSMFQVIFEKYSGLALSNESDRPIAISGLQDRLASFYNTDFTSGVAHRFIHKSLLWRRSGHKWMKPIEFPDRSDRVPSWSWMGYTGQICYGKLPDNGFYHEMELSPAEGKLRARLVQFIGCDLRSTKDTSHKIRSKSGRLVGWLKYDTEHENNDVERLDCIRIMSSGREYAWKEYAEVRWLEDLAAGEQCFVLLLSQRDGVYRRLGVAVVHIEYLTFPESIREIWVE